MATGTGKTYTAFQIIWRLWKAKSKKRILFLADRNVLVDQTRINDFQPFGTAMTKVEGRKVDPAYEIHLALYQALTGSEEQIMSEILIFESSKGTIQVTLKEDSVWLSLNQLSDLFERDKSVISRHLRRIFSDAELDRDSVVAKNTTASGYTWQGFN